MCSEEKLILTYDPLDDENTICSTILTDESANCKVRKINQKTYILRDKFKINLATMTNIENQVLYNNDIYNYTFDLKVLFNQQSDITIYSFSGFSFTNNVVNNRVVNDSTIILTFNLKCEVGTKMYNKLDYILPSSNNGKPVPRTLIFYNSEK
jgi:hypothetical protein